MRVEMAGLQDQASDNELIRDHKAVNEQALALVKKLNVTPQDNETSKSLVRQPDQEHAKWPS